MMSRSVSIIKEILSMITSKHISKIVAAFTALAVAFCLLGMVFSDRLAEAFGGTSVKITREWFGEPTVADPVSPR